MTEAGWVRTVSVPPPSLQDNTADADRLIHALQSVLGSRDIHIDLSLLKRVPNLLRTLDFHVRCVFFRAHRQWHLVGITAPGDEPAPVGAAVDLGTTRVVVRLLDLATGRVLAESAFDNPQAGVGPDILARVHRSDEKGGLAQLNELIITGLNRMIRTLCSDCNLSSEDVFLVSVAGNTTMTHLFMGLDPRWIIREPYIPVVNRPPLLPAKDLGLLANDQARVFVFPNVGSYFGGDLIAGILYSGLHREEGTALLVDVGTNAEVVLGNENWLIACAGAAGPALEGGVTRMGMTAGPGVIDRVTIDPDTREIRYHTIDDHPPRGICGSGVIDLAAHLFLTGMIDIRGKLVPDRCGGLVRVKEEMICLEVVSERNSATKAALTFSQADLDSLVRSKAAMYTILETLAASVGVAFEEVSKFYVAGTFGAFIDPVSAITIGMVPDLPLDRYQTLGNSSLGGATLALTTPACLTEIDAIRDRITYLELNVNQEFMNRFSAAKFIPHTDPSRFPSVKMPLPAEHRRSGIVR